jgi:3-hydroxyacyl-CoA dehydrogenase
VSLGLVPGWGGCFALPRLIGPDAALAVIVDNPLHGNRLLTAADALALGLVDAVLPEPFLDGALAWVAASLAREGRPTRARRAEPEDFHRAAAEARRRTEERVDGAVPAADAAIDLVEAAATRTRQEAHAAEDEALARLLLSDEMRAALYAWELTTRRARRPPGAPDAALARPVRAVGLLGAGLMARQLGLLLARRLRVPVTLREIDAERAEAGRAAILDEVARLHGRGRLDEDEARRLAATVRTTVHLADLRGSDLVIEAVVEDLAVKCRVVAEVEEVLEVGAVIATNTSALSVGAMARAARHPGRVVGLHFFNPVAQMPLVEVVRAAQTDDAALATAFAVVAACGKTAVAVRDAPGFVVNRVLVRLLGEVLGALEEGTSVAVADRALRPMGLPMGPFQLLQLVGPAVAHHVLAELRTGLGDRFPASPGLARLVAEGRPLVVAAQGRPTATSPVDPGIAAYFPGAGPGLDEPALLRRVQDALAEEVSLLLRDGVVPEVEDVDLGMILGAAWPPHLGGISPYLDRTGASERVTGVRFHPPGVASRVGATGSVAGHPPAGAQ